MSAQETLNEKRINAVIKQIIVQREKFANDAARMEAEVSILTEVLSISSKSVTDLSELVSSLKSQLVTAESKITSLEEELTASKKLEVTRSPEGNQDLEDVVPLRTPTKKRT